MALSPGTKLGPYEILSPLGAGGMGEVYRARDTRLDRTVAIKVLPARLSSDPARRLGAGRGLTDPSDGGRRRIVKVAPSELHSSANF